MEVPRKRLRTKTKVESPAPSLSQAAIAGPIEGEEITTARKAVYLVTFPHPRAQRSSDGYALKPPGDFTRKQLLDALLDSCMNPVYTDLKSRSQQPTVTLDKVVVVFENHQEDENGEVFRHGHIGLAADAPFRFLPVKRALLARHGLASHWSCTHNGYHSVVSYLQWPSAKKCAESLDSRPLWWADGRSHPPLDDCRHEPNTAAATKRRREFREKQAAEEGKDAPRATEMDLYAIIVNKGFRNLEDDRTAHLQLMTYARQHCSKQIWEYVWKNRARLPGLIDDVWQTEGIDQTLPFMRMSRTDALQHAAGRDCVCEGKWMEAVVGSFIANEIPVQDLCKDVLKLLTLGRSPDCPVLVLAGRSGGEGKSLFLKALLHVFLRGQVFAGPVAGSFPLLDLLSSKICFFDEWRFDTSVLPWPVQCLLYDGSDVVVNRPQNVAGQSGHVTYTGSSPVFVTTKLADVSRLQRWAEVNPKTGNPWDADASMICRRLKIYEYNVRIQKPPCGLRYCASCFARLVLQQASA